MAHHSPVPAPGDDFARRHIGPSAAEVDTMLGVLGVERVEQLLDATIPAAIRSTAPLSSLPPALTEPEALARLRQLAERNEPRTPLIGMGYYGTHTPGVIRRNVLESPAWYTAYTPYQPEISQGRLEALLNFQTTVIELTGLAVANASLLDEATAAAEAMTMARRLSKSPSTRFVVDHDTHPQTIAVLATRAEPVGVELVVGDVDAELADGCFGALLSYPTSTGGVIDWRTTIGAVRDAGGIAVIATDLLACTVLAAPGELGADIAIGSAQRFGVPLGYGGPHAAFIAAHQEAARAMPGRIVGVSTDRAGRPSLRLALQTREQHIRREKATSNICTAQVLLANIAGLYAAWHGPAGLRAIAESVHGHAAAAVEALTAAGFGVVHRHVFDTVTVDGVDADQLVATAADVGLDLRRIAADRIGFSVDETTTAEVVARLLGVFGLTADKASAPESGSLSSRLPDALRRTTPFLRQSVFNTLHTEHEMLRYLRRLSDRDLALDRTMIPLGSCTMKLNSTTEMESITWSEFADLHPYCPDDESAGTRELIAELEGWLADLTGYDAVSVQPNAGSQGEFAGLLAIRAYHRSRGDDQRDVCLIPASAHGTNAASAVMAGMRVLVVATDREGNVDVDDLRRHLDAVGDRLAAIMVTYPSTHGVFEEGIGELCRLVHDAGGQVYVDGANLNALVGLASPGEFGADVSHLNLHKTFCIPHGGGGPGVGPIGVRAHLVPFLPGDPLKAGDGQPVGPVSAARFGSAGILGIPWAYIAMMGAEGLRAATATAILSANYVARRLEPHFPVLYVGANGFVGHECIIDLRPITKATGVTVDDVAKRLMDYGFHAPTMSFPVAGTLMIEPTESETLVELDRFCAAMVAIRGEIERVAAGEWPATASPLRLAPHTAEDLIGEWERPYSRELGAFPLVSLRRDKYFPPVGRIDGAAGDRHLICTCEPLEAFAAEQAAHDRSPAAVGAAG